MSRDTGKLYLHSISLCNLSSKSSKSFVFCFTISRINHICTNDPESWPSGQPSPETYKQSLAAPVLLLASANSLSPRTGRHVQSLACTDFWKALQTCLGSSTWACQGHQEQFKNNSNPAVDLMPVSLSWFYPDGQLNSTTATPSLTFLKGKGGENAMERAQGLR